MSTCWGISIWVEQWLRQFAHHQWWIMVPFPTSSPELLVVFLTWMRWNFNLVLICTALMAKDVEHLRTYMLPVQFIDTLIDTTFVGWGILDQDFFPLCRRPFTPVIVLCLMETSWFDFNPSCAIRVLLKKYPRQEDFDLLLQLFTKCLLHGSQIAQPTWARNSGPALGTQI